MKLKLLVVTLMLFGLGGLIGCGSPVAPSLEPELPRPSISPSITTMSKGDFVTFMVTGGTPPYRYTILQERSPQDITNCIGIFTELGPGQVQFQFRPIRVDGCSSDVASAQFVVISATRPGYAQLYFRWY